MQPAEPDPKSYAQRRVSFAPQKTCTKALKRTHLPQLCEASDLGRPEGGCWPQLEDDVHVCLYVCP